MRPLVLMSHARPLTCIKYNREGDLLFTCSMEREPTVWFSHNGERLGTYTEDGHRGSVLTLDPSADSRLLVTGGADQSAKVWDVQTGKKLRDFPATGSVRSVEWNEGATMFASAIDPFCSTAATVAVFEVNFEVDSEVDSNASSALPKYAWEVAGLAPGKKITNVTWLPLNAGIVSTDELGVVRVHDVATGHVRRELRGGHTKRIKDLSWSKNKAFLLTGSEDCTAVLWDAADWTVVKVFKSEYPVNAVAVSPIKEHVLIAGGQAAIDSALTSDKHKFHALFFHSALAEKFAYVSGHFGPINCIAMRPDGTGYVQLLVWSRCVVWSRGGCCSPRGTLVLWPSHNN